ncbi:MAG TPA: TraR/DksA C4-type zinc finger protein [Acidimicrobiia bacterium]|nr:TraR/DksA C4-type zinc finger protein [Acidimicrobiia bacterium]
MKKRQGPAKKAPPAKKKPVAKKKTAPAKKQTAATTAKATKTAAGKKVAATPLPARAAPEVPVRTLKKGHVICELSGFEVLPGGPALSPKTIERLRLKLVDERERLLHQAEELAAEADQLAHDREAGDTQFDEESGEGDTVNVERERDLLLSASARNAVEEIDEALVRIKKGTYGFCSPAGKRLSLDRLEAFPWANVCVDCKARAERRR